MCVCVIYAGVFIVRGREDVLATLNLVPGESVYGEKRVAVEVRDMHDRNARCIIWHNKEWVYAEYRVFNAGRWNKEEVQILESIQIQAGSCNFRWCIADIHIKSGSKVIYLGAALGTLQSAMYLSDIVIMVVIVTYLVACTADNVLYTMEPSDLNAFVVSNLLHYRKNKLF